MKTMTLTYFCMECKELGRVWSIVAPNGNTYRFCNECVENIGLEDLIGIWRRKLYAY